MSKDGSQYSIWKGTVFQLPNDGGRRRPGLRTHGPIAIEPARYACERREAALA